LKLRVKGKKGGGGRRQDNSTPIAEFLKGREKQLIAFHWREDFTIGICSEGRKGKVCDQKKNTKEGRLRGREERLYK